MKIPYIDEKKVKRLLRLDELIPLLKKSLKEKKSAKTQMPSKSYLFFKKEKGDLRIMPCFVEGFQVAGIKHVTVHSNNAENFNLPSVMAHLFLYNPINGLPLCYMDATYLTAVRTSAVAAIAADILSRKKSSVVGLLGAGFQAIHQLEGLLQIRKIETVKIFSKEVEPLEKFLAYYEKRGIELIPVSTARKACEETDILITTTPSRRPIVKKQWIKEGIHINAIGADAPDKQEIDDELIVKSKIVVDDMTQAIHSGEINVPFSKGIINHHNILGEIDTLIKGKIGRDNDKDITLFDSTGLAIQDIVAGYLVYKKSIHFKQ